MIWTSYKYTAFCVNECYNAVLDYFKSLLDNASSTILLVCICGWTVSNSENTDQFL